MALAIAFKLKDQDLERCHSVFREARQGTVLADPARILPTVRERMHRSLASDLAAFRRLERLDGMPTGGVRVCWLAT